MNKRAERLAERIEQGARALAAFAESMSGSEWKAPTQPDGRTVGVIVHHVASMYSIEVELAQTLAAGNAITGVTWAAVGEINAKHAETNSKPDKKQTLELLLQNSKLAADAVRKLTDEDLDRAAAVSLNGDAPLTTQFFIEDHALRHSFHHLSKIRTLLKS